MEKNSDKPSPEAKALSLFLMAYKSTSPKYKEDARRMNKLWDQVVNCEISKSDYLDKVDIALTSYGGYEAVIEKTVQYYINKTGEWKLKGDDTYCQDAQKIADKIKGN